MTLAENIAQAIADFDSIKVAIESKGVAVGNAPTSQYADKIEKISVGGSGLSFQATELEVEYGSVEVVK